MSAIGPAYLGGKYAPFAIFGDPNKPGTTGGLNRLATAGSRRGGGYFAQLDHGPVSSTAQLMGEFQQQALDILSRPDARRAFDLEQEPVGAPRPLWADSLGPAMLDCAATRRGRSGPRHRHPVRA